MSTPSPGPRELVLAYELGAMDRLVAAERAALEDELEVCTSFASSSEDPLGVLGPVLGRLRTSHASELVWAGPGWHRLIGELDERLAALVPEYGLVQVKEKFGGLRYYTQLPSTTPAELREQFRGLVSGAEAASYWLCEVCGRAGRTRGRTRIRTLCATHRRWGVHEA